MNISSLMDDQKIQLESRQDYEFVRSNFLNYIKEMKDCNKFSMEEIESVYWLFIYGTQSNLFVLVY